MAHYDFQIICAVACHCKCLAMGTGTGLQLSAQYHADTLLLNLEERVLRTRCVQPLLYCISTYINLLNPNWPSNKLDFGAGGPRHHIVPLGQGYNMQI